MSIERRDAEATLNARNIGGIDEASVSFDPGDCLVALDDDYRRVREI